MALTANEYLKKVKITATVNDKEREVEVPRGLAQLLEDYHQTKLKESMVASFSLPLENYDTPLEKAEKSMFRDRAFVHYYDGSIKEFKFKEVVKEYWC